MVEGGSDVAGMHSYCTDVWFQYNYLFRICFFRLEKSMKLNPTNSMRRKCVNWRDSRGCLPFVITRRSLKENLQFVGGVQSILHTQYGQI